MCTEAQQHEPLSGDSWHLQNVGRDSSEQGHNRGNDGLER
jgi:hypothetical protein